MIGRTLLAATLGFAIVPAAAPPSYAVGPVLSVADVGVVAEPNWPNSVTEAAFTVTLDEPATEPVTMSYHLYASSWSVMPPSTGSLTLAPGASEGQIEVEVGRDTASYADGWFTVEIYDVVGADIAEPEGRWNGSAFVYDAARAHGYVRNSDRTGRFYCGAEAARGGTGTGPAVLKGNIYTDCESDTSYSLKQWSYTSAPRVPTALHVSVGELRTVIDGVERATPPADTRPYLGDGGDAYAHASDIRITAPGLDIRIEDAWASATMRCTSLDGALPALTSGGMLTGVTVNGRPIEVGDKVNYRIGQDYQTGIIFNADYTSPKGGRMRTAILVGRDSGDWGDLAIARVHLAPGYPGTGYYSNPCTDRMKDGERYPPLY